MTRRRAGPMCRGSSSPTALSRRPRARRSRQGYGVARHASLGATGQRPCAGDSRPRGGPPRAGRNPRRPLSRPRLDTLSLTAGGLVMEMGGAMSHGAVVAREYGIPAVVGVPLATEAIANGTELIVDGTTGPVVIGDGFEPSEQR